MTEADDPHSGESRYFQLPWQLVGGVLFAARGKARSGA